MSVQVTAHEPMHELNGFFVLHVDLWHKITANRVTSKDAVKMFNVATPHFAFSSFSKDY